MGGVVSSIVRQLRGSDIVPNQTIQKLEESASQVRKKTQEVPENMELVEGHRVEAEDPMRNAQKMVDEATRRYDEAERKLNEARQFVEEALRRIEEDRRKADDDKRELQEAKDEAERQAEVANIAHQEALENLHVQIARADEVETKWMRGDRPVVWPPLEEIEDAKMRFGYTEGKFHFAIAGVAGSGKSSLINAFHGLTNKDSGTANTGVVETTSHVTGYPDPNPKNPFIWYDIPGAGTLDIPDWQYFVAQGLFVFDCIIVLIDNRFFATDIAILENCKRFNIPSYIVRSKANQHISNIMEDMGYDFEMDDGTQRAEMFPVARARFIAETRESVKANLEKAGLPPKRVYIISKDAMVKIIQGRGAAVMDEVQLVEDILEESAQRRLKPKCRDWTGTNYLSTPTISQFGNLEFY
ncbi:hypothetical protein JAAARDRAFT_589171 [Jaapia argillacea MUCL 33604]|uniref:IRG-type G domain-containing protein n=1 Tax=Jaapia argillacea MUCL 33604 TaxID=933084 RepID=A0A067P5S1_9AGAM|nr:hypothetical protein JAAARDRAFT_589171 [Jaapia argillacea MUCL 33604]